LLTGWRKKMNGAECGYCGELHCDGGCKRRAREKAIFQEASKRLSVVG
jgi:hypothetical protein